jgi:hypothetical protein
MIQDQYYVFIKPGTTDAWCEMFYSDADGDHHVTAPTPYYGPQALLRAMERLELLHPTALVDELMADDIGDALNYTL